MIVLDTNVVSAVMLPEKRVIDWLNWQPLDTLWLSSVTVFEVSFGLELMPFGRKLRQRIEAFDRLMNDKLKGRVASFDIPAARHAAKFAAARRSDGRPVAFRDIEIAGIVSARSATLATRNVDDFSGFSVDIVNPWNP